ncbi:MAG: hypothetical protein ACFFCI_12280 [Promethearchaeota archaeon]
MVDQKRNPQQNKKIIINWLAHHNPKREDFDEHVFYILKYAFCIGCFSFAISVTVALIISNLFYYYLVRFFSLPAILIIFLICWIPSILQYATQIVRKRPIRNRGLKFLIRFLYPMGSIFLIFKSPLIGFILAVPAGYLIIYIRKIKNKTLAN